MYLVFSWQMSLNLPAVSKFQGYNKYTRLSDTRLIKVQNLSIVRSGLTYFLNIVCSYVRHPLKENNLLKKHIQISFVNVIHSAENSSYKQLIQKFKAQQSGPEMTFNTWHNSHDINLILCLVQMLSHNHLEQTFTQAYSKCS